MKTIIAGSRNITDYELVREAIEESGFNITEVVSGGCKGIDDLGAIWAKINGLPITMFNADWDKYGKTAGPIRNKQMAEYAQALIVIWDGKSKGTKSMIDEANAKNLKVFIKRKVK